LGMQSRSKCRIAIVLPSIILIFLTGLSMIPAILAFQHFRENQLAAIDTEGWSRLLRQISLQDKWICLEVDSDRLFIFVLRQWS